MRIRALPTILALILALASAAAAPARAEGRKASIRWRPVEGAVKYEFQLSRTPEMDPLSFQKTYASTSIKLSLGPGTYYFRVRGVDEKDAPGPWTEVQGFTVNPSAPEPVRPADGQVFKETLENGLLEFEWKEGVSGTVHQVEIIDAQGATAVWKSTQTSLKWKVPSAGLYQWRVGYDSPSGPEWAPYRRFQVDPSAMPKTVVEIRETDTADAGFDTGPRHAQWSAIARGAEAVAAYTINDRDTDTHASGAALVAFLSAELRWRGPKRRNQVWTLSGALNFEMISQTVLGQTFNMPRAYARVFYGRESGKWRLGGFAHFSAGQAGIFVVEGQTQARSARVFRQGFGLGGMATYRASSSLFLSGILMGRLDVGGDSSQLPSALLPTFGFEAGFGLALNLTETLFLEGRLRAIQETYAWRPALGGTQNSSLSNTFLLLDAGVGLTF